MSNIPGVYAGMQTSTAVLRKGDDVVDTPRHLDDVVYATLRFDESSDLHQKQHHVPYSLAILLNGTF